MKKYLFAIAMVLTLSMNADAAAQRHRHTPRTEQTDSTKNKPSAIEAFSDTTTVAGDTIDVNGSGQQISIDVDDDTKGVLHEVFSNLDGKDIAGMIFVLLIIMTVFLFAPIGIIIAIFYFVNKNRRDRIKLAQMAMEKGQPIPDQLLKEGTNPIIESDYQTGIRQMFTGIGLAIFLGIVVGKIGFGIGALVFFIGLGKWFIARQSGIGRNDTPFGDSTEINNHINNSEQ